MTMKKFRKRSVEIEAVQITDSMFDSPHPNPEHIVGVVYDPTPEFRCAFIKTKEGTMRGDLGDWIIRGVKGELYPCKPDIFAMTYDPVEASASTEPVWKWYAGTSEERYDVGPCDTREQAIEEGKFAFDGDQFFIIEAAKGDYDLHVFDAGTILESIDDANNDLLDPDSDGHSIEATPAQCVDLESMLNAAIDAWAVKHNIKLESYCFKHSRHRESIPAEPEETAAAPLLDDQASD